MLLKDLPWPPQGKVVSMPLPGDKMLSIYRDNIPRFDIYLDQLNSRGQIDSVIHEWNNIDALQAQCILHELTHGGNK